jgi:transcription termination factor NusB
MMRACRIVPVIAAALACAASPLAARHVQTPPPGQAQAKPQAADPKVQPTSAAQAKNAQAKAVQADAAQDKKESPVEQPEDFKAFNEASKITDPVKKSEALQKFAADYPESILAPTAGSEVFSQLFNSVRDNSRKLQAEIDKSIKANGGGLSAYSTLASRLFRAGILIDEAERLALKGLEFNDPQKFIEEARSRQKSPAADVASPPGGASAGAGVKGTRSGSFRMSSANGVTMATWIPPTTEKPAATPPAGRRERSDDELRADFRSQRAALKATLGQIYVKWGRTAEAEKLFKEIYGDNDLPSSSKTTAARELAALAKTAGDDKARIEYLTTSVVLGAAPAVRIDLDDVYRKTHNGSLDGLDAMLDERYEKTLKPLEVKPYVRPKTSEPRLVLAELFTGAACPPCVGADLAWDAALERFSRQDVALLVYHEHIPGPDAMTNPSSVKRLGFYGVRGVPTFYIDGVTDGAGGGGAEQAESIYAKRIEPAVEKALATAPGAKVSLAATITGSTIAVKAGVGPVAGKSEKLRLQIALVEEHRTYSGANGVRFHSMVVRNLAAEKPKGKAEPADAKAKEAPAKDDTAGDAQAKDAPPADAAAKEVKVVEPTGFAVTAAKGAKVDYVFDVATIVAENRKAIDEFLTKPFRGGDKPIFAEREDDIDTTRLVVVAFVQDEATKQILQAASVKIAPSSKK